MFTTLTNFFNTHLKAKDNTDDEPTVDKFQLAGAALLVELCKADQEIDMLETEKLIAILEKKFALPKEALDDLISMAHQESDDSTSLYQFTSLLNEEYTYAEKARLLTDMWEVAYADGDLDRYEDHLIRKVADLLYITHSDFIKSKLSVKNKL